MGSELLRIADGFSMVADGLRGLAGMEWNGAADTAEKDVFKSYCVRDVDVEKAIRRKLRMC